MLEACKFTLSTLGLLLIVVNCLVSLKLTELRVPEHVPLGTRAQLSCRWQLGPTDVLYSVKWYKDGNEFFRHVPRDVETRRKFPLPGVEVENSDDAGSNVTLARVQLESSGRYRCEVSGEGPLFPTVSAHGDLTVYALPDHGPVLSGFRPRYRVGDRVQVNCTSGRSRPATQLDWYINGEPAPPSSIRPQVVKLEDGLETTMIELDFIAKDRHLGRNGIKVTCLATLAPFYWRSNEESALQERALEDSLAVRRDVDDGTRADRVHSNSACQTLAKTFSVFVIIILGFTLQLL